MWSAFPVAQSLPQPSYVAFAAPHALASDATQFAFAAPFVVRLVFGGVAPYGNGNGNGSAVAAQWSVTIKTTHKDKEMKLVEQEERVVRRIFVRVSCV